MDVVANSKNIDKFILMTAHFLKKVEYKCFIQSKITNFAIVPHASTIL